MVATQIRASWKALAPHLIPGMLRRLTRKQGVGRKSVQQVLGDVERHADALAGLLGNREWLVGDALSLADLSVFSQIRCIRGIRREGARHRREPADGGGVDGTGGRSHRQKPAEAETAPPSRNQKLYFAWR